MIRNIWTIARRELGAIFIQPIAYVFATAMAFLTGLFFALDLSFQVTQGLPPTMEGALGVFTFLMLFAAPAISMRLLAEEQKSGTFELLMTLPVRDGEVVLGKFLAAFIFYLVATALTLIFPLILLRFGNPDFGVLLSSYLGVLLWGGMLLSIGVFASALSENQINAFMLTFGISLVLFLASFPGQAFGLPPWLATTFEELSMQSHLNNFLRGLIEAKDVAYYLGISTVMLFGATLILISRRWR